MIHWRASAMWVSARIPGMKERITVQVFDLNQPLTRKNSGMARSFAFGVAVSLAAAYLWMKDGRRSLVQLRELSP